MTETGTGGHGTPAYYWRWGTPYVAWFCEPEAAQRWLENGQEIYTTHEPSYLAAAGHEPEPDVKYQDLGHEHCMADNCPEDGDDD